MSSGRNLLTGVIVVEKGTLKKKNVCPRRHHASHNVHRTVRALYSTDDNTGGNKFHDAAKFVFGSHEDVHTARPSTAGDWCETAADSRALRLPTIVVTSLRRTYINVRRRQCYRERNVWIYLSVRSYTCNTRDHSVCRVRRKKNNAPCTRRIISLSLSL